VKSFTLVVSHTFSRISDGNQFQHIDAVHEFLKCASAFQIIISVLKHGKRDGVGAISKQKTGCSSFEYLYRALKQATTLRLSVNASLN
jgi:hypothetical protein